MTARQVKALRVFAVALLALLAAFELIPGDVANLFDDKPEPAGVVLKAEEGE